MHISRARVQCIEKNVQDDKLRKCRNYARYAVRATSARPSRHANSLRHYRPNQAQKAYNLLVFKFKEAY